MDPIDIVGQWFVTVNEQLGTSFELSASGSCAIEFQKSTTLFLQVLPEEEFVVLYSPLETLEARPDVLHLLGVLALNTFNRFTGFGGIGYDAERHSLIYSERLDIGRSNALEFASRLDQFPAHWSCLMDTLSELRSQRTCLSNVGHDEEAFPSPMDPRFLKI